VFWIRIQHCRLNTDSDPGPIRVQGFDDQKLENIYSAIFFSHIFWIKNSHLLIPGLHKKTSKLQESLQPSKENIQHFKT
jgi:hypothetical protein